MINKEQIQDLAADHFDAIRADRRHLHKHPELSFHEVETASYISDRLDQMGIKHTTGRGGHGIVAVLGRPTDVSVTLRADIDALPIEEENDVIYRSANKGVMHACGHDVHTASLLGTAHILKTVEEQLPGAVKLIFQPAEELLPGGASIMIKEGVLSEAPTTQSIFGQHVHPPLPAGSIGLKHGVYMASADEIYLTVKGKGGHAALPREMVDSVQIAAQILISLQQVVSRMADPSIPSVLSFGKINSVGGATNIIPNEVRIEGTFRTFSEEWRYEAHDHIRRVAENTAKAMRGTCDVLIKVGYPYLLNNSSLCSRFQNASEDYLGAEQVVELPIRMTAEDFAYYSHEVPACFYRLGTGNVELGITSPVHSSTFDIDEEALRTGSGLMAWAAIKELQFMMAR